MISASSSENELPATESSVAGPSEFWMGAGFFLAGMGTVVLGPLLPSLSRSWQLQDSGAGLLLLAKFTGAFLGGVTVPRKLRFGILLGLAASSTGFAAFAFAHSLLPGAAALLVAGFGLGQLIASTNILAGRRYRQFTGAALARINFFWSLGAVATGVLIAKLLPHHSLPSLLLTFALSFLVVGLGSRVKPYIDRTSPLVSSAAEATGLALPRRTFLLFSLILFLYGGLETCLTQWLTTYTLRYTVGYIIGGQSTIVILWTALTLGRAGTSLLLERLSETLVQRVALACSVVLIPIVANTHSALVLSICCVLLGFSLAPFFPSAFALLMRRSPSAREAGFILAVSGLGAAGFSWLMGVLSTATGSLRMAMVVPFTAALGLLIASFFISAPAVAIVPQFPTRADV